MKLWLLRDKEENAFYELWEGTKPVKDSGGIYWRSEQSKFSTFLKSFCPDKFNQICNIRLKPGQCVRICKPIIKEYRKAKK